MTSIHESYAERQRLRYAGPYHPEIGIEEHPTLSRKQQKALYEEILAQGGPKVLSNVYHPDNWGSGDPAMFHHYVARGQDGTIHGVLTAMRDYKKMEPKKPLQYPELGVHDVYSGEDAPKGTGSALMQAAAHRAMRDGAKFKVWGVVPHARGFYHALGGTCEPNFSHFEWSQEDRDALAMGTPNRKPVTPMSGRLVGNPNPPFDNDLVDPVMPPGADEPIDFGQHFVPEDLRKRQPKPESIVAQANRLLTAMAWQDHTDNIKHIPPDRDPSTPLASGTGRLFVDPKDWGDRWGWDNAQSWMVYTHRPVPKKIEIDSIGTRPDFRRDGMQEALFRKLYETYPDHTIDPGYMTSEGQAFHDRMLQKEPTARDLVTAAQRVLLAAVSNDLIGSLEKQFDAFHSGKGKDRIGYWPHIEDFMQSEYPAAYRGLDMGRERARPLMDSTDDAVCGACKGSGADIDDERFDCFGCGGAGKFDPGQQYETGPEAEAKHGYDPKEIVAGMLLLHNKAHGYRRNYLDEDTDRLMDIAQKRYQMQRNYESRQPVMAATIREARQLLLAMAWQDWAPHIQHAYRKTITNNNNAFGTFFIDHSGEGKGGDSPYIPTLARRGIKTYLNYLHHPDSKDIYVESIQTHPEFRRDGVQESLFRKLHETYPDHAIHPGMMTSDGRGFHDKMLQKEPTARELVVGAEPQEEIPAGHYRDLDGVQIPDYQSIYAQKRTTAQAYGDCYEAAGRYMMDNGLGDPDSFLRVVHGEVAGQGPMKGKTFGHAWVEVHDPDNDEPMVIDPSNGGDLHMPMSQYYNMGKINQLNNYHSYTPQEAAKKMTELQHFGPWDLTVNGEAPPGRMELDEDDDDDWDDFKVY